MPPAEPAAGPPPTVPPKPGAIGPDEAWARIAAAAAPLRGEDVPVAAAAGRRLATDVHAAWALPQDTNSAMDGFAVRAADGPWSAARVVGESRAGAPLPSSVGAGEVARIATGATLPAGTDAVVPVEQATLRADGDAVDLPSTSEGKHVRFAGEDVAVGERLASAGTRVAAHHQVALAAAGLATVGCHRRPVVHVVVTGDEVVAPGTMPAPGQVVDVHGVALPSLVEAAGGRTGEILHVPDGRAELESALRGLPTGDVVVVTGGLSVGRHDHTRASFDALGIELIVPRLLMRPGQPTAVGTADLPQGRLWFGLPGNPVSAYVVASLLLVPAIRRLAGDPDAAPAPRAAILGAEARPDPRRWLALRATVEREEAGERIVVLAGQASHMVGALAASSVLALLAPGETPLAEGSRVDVVDLVGSGA